MLLGAWLVSLVNCISFNSEASVNITNNKIIGQKPANRYFDAFVPKKSGFEIGSLGLTRIHYQERIGPQSEILNLIQEDSLLLGIS